MEKRNIKCGICPSGCNVEGIFSNNRLKKIKKIKNGNICLRGIHSPDILYSKDRLTSPLIRYGKKSTNSLKKATWDEALDYTAENFLSIKEKYGPQSLISHFGRGAFDTVTDVFATNTQPNKKSIPSFFEPLGSPNQATVSSLCYVSYGVFAPFSTLGIYGNKLSPDLENSELIFIWGTNPYNASPPANVKRLIQAKKNGAKIIVIDHYENRTFKLADESILIHSGTDGLFILGIIKYLIENNLYNEDFIENYTYGFSELVEYLNTLNYDFIEKTTGVKNETLVKLAKELHISQASSYISYTGLEYAKSGVQSIRALISLFAITGNLDIKGGLLINMDDNELGVNKIESPHFNIERIGADKYPLFDKLLSQSQFMEFPEAVLNSKPYKIAGLLNIGSVISVNYPNSKLYQEALSKLNFFATADRFLTKDSDFADVIFPSTTHYEDFGYVKYNNRVEIRNRVIEPIGESKPNIFILHEIAKRLGYGYLYPKDDEEILTKSFETKPNILDILKKEGVYYFPKKDTEYKKYEKGLLRIDGLIGFPTKTGKFELKSSILEEYNYEPLPKFVDNLKYYSSYKDYPLVLNTGARINNTFRTQHLNIEELVKYQPYPFAIMNPLDAKKRNIIDGDKVKIVSKIGSVIFYAKISEGILPGEVELNVGGGSKYQSEHWKNANANLLTDNENTDSISGFPCFKTLLCEISKEI